MVARLGLKILLATSALLLTLVALTAWLTGALTYQEAAGQTSRTPATTEPPASSPAPEAANTSSASVTPGGLDDLFGDAFGSASASAQADQPEGIPGLSVMEVIDNLEHFPIEGDFLCEGPTTGDGGSTLWRCSAADSGSGSYELVLVGDDPLTVLSVEATAYGASEETAAEFFGYVGALCLEETDPLNPEAWAREFVPTGGQTFAEGAELSVYGTGEARTLQVVASDPF